MRGSPSIKDPKVRLAVSIGIDKFLQRNLESGIELLVPVSIPIGIFDDDIRFPNEPIQDDETT